jgi:hypothetical protein
MMRRLQKGGMAALIRGSANIALHIALAYTILGSFAYWLFSWVIGWGGVGIVTWIIFRALGGLAPGIAAAAPLGQYLFFRDPQILWYSALPAFCADLIEGIFSKNPTLSETGDV